MSLLPPQLPPAAPKNHKDYNRNNRVLWISIGAVILLAAIVVGVSNKARSDGSGAAATTTTLPPSFAAAGNSDSTGNSSNSGNSGNSRSKAASANNNTATNNHASFKCAGNAPAGVSITYGADTQNFNGSSNVPWSATLPIPPGAMDEAVTAQLRGGGLITCNVTVNQSGSTATHSASASGDYNIAMAELCNVGEGWQKC